MKQYEQHYESKQKHWLKDMGDENKANLLTQKLRVLKTNEKQDQIAKETYQKES